MLSWRNDSRRQSLKLSWMNWAGFEYLVGHRFYPNHKRFEIHIYFLHETKSVCLHCIRLSFTKISVTFKVWRGEWWWNNYLKTTKARNLKFGQMISLYMNLRPSIFGDATSRGLEHMHTNLVSAKLLGDFSLGLARASLAEWFKTPLLKSYDLGSVFYLAIPCIILISYWI